MTDYPSWEDLSEKEQLESIYSDTFKDVNGFRPRGFEMTVPELKVALDALYAEVEIQFRIKEERQQSNVLRFMDIVKDTMALCSCGREKAIDFLLQAEEVGGDWEHFCYNYDLPYGFKRS